MTSIPASPLASTVTTWTIDPAHTLVEFSARHLMITTGKGRFSRVRGVIRADEAQPDCSMVEVVIDTDSVTTGDDKRDAHLRSADFLDVEHHPVITYRSRQVDGAYGKAGDHFGVLGDLTI